MPRCVRRRDVDADRVRFVVDRVPLVELRFRVVLVDLAMVASADTKNVQRESNQQGRASEVQQRAMMREASSTIKIVPSYFANPSTLLAFS